MKEIDIIKNISGLPFESAGKMPRHSGSGKKGNLPLFNLHWENVVKKPEIDFRIPRTAERFREQVKITNAKWLSDIDSKIDAGIKKLVNAGYVIEDPILMTYVYEYSSFFIYKEKVRG